MLKLLGSVLFCATAAFAQTAPRFEVTSVKPAPPGEPGARIQFLPGGIYRASNVAIRFIIQNAYQIRDFQIVGDLAALKTIADGYDARYYVEAQADPSTTEAQMREMVKQLLVDRFAMKVHTETREFPVYALIPAKSGVKLERSTSATPGSGSIELVDRGWTRANNVTMAPFIEVLSRNLDRPVIDRTGFTDAFRYQLTYLADPTVDPSTLSPGGCPRSFSDIQEKRNMKLEPLSCPDLFTAIQEQMGLKLDAQKAPIEVLVVDHAEKPTAN